MIKIMLGRRGAGGGELFVDWAATGSVAKIPADKTEAKRIRNVTVMLI